jgi:hypothetical protein
MLEDDARVGLRLTTAWRSAGIPGNLAFKTFRGRMLFEAEGWGMGVERPSSESLPTAGRLDDVTEVSEFRRGRVEGRRAVFLKIGLAG